ncbi:replication initiator protein [Salmonella enterica]|nr:replication initiator protein [Salmonella enterica]
MRQKAASSLTLQQCLTTDYLQQCQISCQLKLIRFTGESAIAFSLLSGQKVNGHIGLPA